MIKKNKNEEYKYLNRPLRIPLADMWPMYTFAEKEWDYRFDQSFLHYSLILKSLEFCLVCRSGCQQRLLEATQKDVEELFQKYVVRCVLDFLNHYYNEIGKVESEIKKRYSRIYEGRGMTEADKLLFRCMWEPITREVGNKFDLFRF